MNEIRIYRFQKQFVAIFNVFFYKSLDGVLGIRTRGRRTKPRSYGGHPAIFNVYKMKKFCHIKNCLQSIAPSLKGRIGKKM